MKSISLSIVINIPVIYHKHPFSEISLHDEFYNINKTKSYVKYLADYKLLPFFKSVRFLSDQFGSRFRLSVSISGVSIRLLEKFAPYVIDEMKVLNETNTFEFFARHWSDSILPYFIHKEQVHQTSLQRRTIEEIFGQLPSVFIADTTLNSGTFSRFIPYPELKTVFISSNQLPATNKKEESLKKNPTQFLINQSLSQKLQQISSDNYKENKAQGIAPFKRYLRKHVSLVKPLILLFDPLARNISEYTKWQAMVALLLTETKSSFYTLSDLEEISNYFSIENKYSEDMLLQFRLADDWMKNNMQKEAFKQFRNIYKIMKQGSYSFRPDAWDYLQDTNNFFFMSDSFFLEDFSSRHYNPFRSPHEAFSSYMNAISNFWNLKKDYTQPIVKTDLLFSPASN